MPNPRVALIGLALESNRGSRPASEEDFRSVCWLEGEEILTQARAATPAMPMEAAAFVKAMDATGPWQPLPILIASSFPAGPIEQATFERAGLHACRSEGGTTHCGGLHLQSWRHDRYAYVRSGRGDGDTAARGRRFQATPRHDA